MKELILRMTKHRLLWLLGISTIVLSVAIKSVTVDYWIQIDWNVTSYSPWAPSLAIAGAICYMSILYLRGFKRLWQAPALWLTGLLWLGFSIIWMWAVNINGKI